MKDLPRISIIIPSRNRAQYLKRGLDSILESDYPNLEIVVMDGASTDDTVRILKTYGDRITKWVSEPDGGEYFAINKGLTFTTGEIIKFMSDDDVLRPHSLAIAGRYFMKNPDVDVVFGQQHVYHNTPEGYVLVHDRPITDVRSITLRNWIRRSIGPPGSIASFVRRRVIDKLGDMTTDIWPGDVEFWARIARHGVRMVILPDHFVDYYLHGENDVMTRARENVRSYYHTARLHGNIADVLYVLVAKLLVFEITNPIVMAAHALGLHPLRWWFSMRTKKKRKTG